MGEKRSPWETLGYAAMMSAIIVGVMEILLQMRTSEYGGILVVTYGSYGVFSSLPLVLAFQRGISFFGTVIRKKGKNASMDLTEEEYIIVDTRPHHLYFLKLYIGIIASVLLLIGMLRTYSPLTSDYMDSVWIFIVSSVILAIVAHIFLKNALKASKIMYLGEKIWSISFAVLWAFVAIDYSMYRFKEIYPTQMWEKFLGIPSVSMLLLAVIIFIISSIF